MNFQAYYCTRRNMHRSTNVPSLSQGSQVHIYPRNQIQLIVQLSMAIICTSHNHTTYTLKGCDKLKLSFFHRSSRLLLLLACSATDVQMETCIQGTTNLNYFKKSIHASALFLVVLPYSCTVYGVQSGLLPYSSLEATMEYVSREFNRFLATRTIYEYSISFRLSGLERRESLISRETRHDWQLTFDRYCTWHHVPCT